MKKLICLLLVLMMLCGLAACGGSEETTTTAAPEQSAAEETTAAAAEETTTAAAEETTTEPEPTTTTEPPLAGDEIRSDNVSDYEKFLATDDNMMVFVDTYVQATTPWADDRVNIYAQSEDGAYYLYHTACPPVDAEKLVPGTKIRISGYKSSKFGGATIEDGIFQVLEDEEPRIFEAQDISALLGPQEATEELALLINSLVRIPQLTVVKAAEQQEDGDLIFYASVNGTTYMYKVEADLTDSSTTLYQSVQNLAVDDVFGLEAFLTYGEDGMCPTVTVIGTDFSE